MRSEQRLSRFEPVASGFTYLRRGLAITRRDPLLYLAIVVVYAAPALIAGYLAATVREPTLGEQAAMVSLPWITAVLGTVVVMIAVSYHAHGGSVGLGRASWEALPWVPRYFWTNCHTTPIFWIPVGLLLTARVWQETILPLAGAPQLGLGLLWWLLIAVVAVRLHTRTLLPPFLGVHGDLPGTLPTLEPWRLSGR